jgi:hypothetical protein
VGEVFASLAINHIIDKETLNKFSKWYQDTALEELTGITPDKLNSTNLGALMKTCGMRVRLSNPLLHQPLPFNIRIASLTKINVVYGEHIQFQPHAFNNFS